MTDWTTAKHTYDNALKALATLTGDDATIRLIESVLTYQYNERRRLQADLDRLRTGDTSHRTGKRRTLSVEVADGTYSRDQPLIRMAWTCEICGQPHDREQLPGNTPKYCPPGEGEKKSNCQREAARRRVAQHRRRKAAQQAGNDVTGYAKRVTSDEQERPFRPTPAQLKLLKRAAGTTNDKPHYVTRDTGNHAVLVELQRAGLVEIFTRGNSTKRRYYQLTAAGRAAAKRRFDQL